MKKLFGLALLAACVSPSAASEIGDLQELKSMVQNSEEFDFRLLVVCGASSGKGFYLNEPMKGWQDDEIAQGRFLLVEESNGDRDVLFMDATGEFQSALKDGAAVLPIKEAPDRSAFVWVVAYPATGVTETFNLLQDDSGGVYLLWSSNKPATRYPTDPPVTLLGKVSSFVARCV